jgi:hypothetical protein
MRPHLHALPSGGTLSVLAYAECRLAKPTVDTYGPHGHREIAVEQGHRTCCPLTPEVLAVLREHYGIDPSLDEAIAMALASTDRCSWLAVERTESRAIIARLASPGTLADDANVLLVTPTSWFGVAVDGMYVEPSVHGPERWIAVADAAALFQFIERYAGDWKAAPVVETAAYIKTLRGASMTCVRLLQSPAGVNDGDLDEVFHYVRHMAALQRTGRGEPVRARRAARGLRQDDGLPTLAEPAVLRQVVVTAPQGTVDVPQADDVEWSDEERMVNRGPFDPSLCDDGPPVGEAPRARDMEWADEMASLATMTSAQLLQSQVGADDGRLEDPFHYMPFMVALQRAQRREAVRARRAGVATADPDDA